jgi:hypothetical protein
LSRRRITTAAAASYAVQAEVSACTAHGKRLLGRAASRVRFAASPLRRFAPLTRCSTVHRDEKRSG